ncbi:hypothetical protein GCM10009779_02200 [Polymorphospora rubra]|uniref:Transposase n=1 Tax=Polymorphospora rubra TaxID=338584 RepID=A0A810N214_9ACTN|nr:hypothetical protein Prubr_27590 [Polymorphospora rubra]
MTRAIGQIRPLLAGRAGALSNGLRRRTLANVIAYATSEGVPCDWTPPRSESADPASVDRVAKPS